jgi:fructose-bisphosphate aldolase class I
MKTAELVQTAKALMTPGKGLLAMDESTHTCNQRFAEAGIAQNSVMRQRYRQLLVTAPGLSEGISGAIFYDETIRQMLTGAGESDGESFAAFLTRAEIIPGIKVDLGTTGLAMFPHEVVTQGLDELAARAREYADMGARFAKWRAVITIGADLPTLGCIEANAHTLARYAAICQEAGLLPIVEPEVIMDGEHDLARCEAVTEDVLAAVFEQLRTQRVCLEAVILKPNMILPGLSCTEQVSNEQVAQATWRCLRRVVPAAVAGIAFLSGGQPDVQATQQLNAICGAGHPSLPWPITFSFARALQRPALKLWAGKPENVGAAQHALLHRVRCNSAAQLGQYSPDTEASGDAAIHTLSRGSRVTA